MLNTKIYVKIREKKIAFFFTEFKTTILEDWLADGFFFVFIHKC